MNTIIGRKEQLSLLNDIWARKPAQLLAVYGRRRVGKTFLVRNFFEPKGKFFEVSGKYGASKSEQLAIFCERFSKAFELSYPISVPSTWKGAFELFTTEIEKAKTKITIFLDELPWLAGRGSELIGELDYYWNNYWSKKSGLKLIVCGSATSWILGNIVNATGGLHNRLTASMLLEPLKLPEVKSYLEAKQIKMSNAALLELYLCIGGVPYYLELVKKNMSVAQILQDLFFKESAPLSNEYRNLFHSLFSTPEPYLKIIDALAKKRYGLRQSDIEKLTSISKGGRLSSILNELEECCFIKRYIPFERTSRDSYYRLIDEFTLFFKNWVEPEKRSQISFQPNYWFFKYKTPQFASWSGYSFETVCHKHVTQILTALRIGGIGVDISHWQSRGKVGHKPGAQVDLVLNRADDVVNLCEVKFTRKPFALTKRDVETLSTRELIFADSTKTKKHINSVLIASNGLKENEYSRQFLADTVSGDDICNG